MTTAYRCNGLYYIDETPYTKQEVWQYLKAEAKWKRQVRQWLRAEGVPRHVLMERRRGRPEQPRYNNRAARRARKREFERLFKRLKRIS